MAQIVFDVLIPQAAAHEVGDAFSLAVKILVDREILRRGTVKRQDEPDIDQEVIDELYAVHERDHG